MVFNNIPILCGKEFALLPIRFWRTDSEILQRVETRQRDRRIGSIEAPAAFQAPKLGKVSLVILDDFIEQLDRRVALGHPGRMHAP